MALLTRRWWRIPVLLLGLLSIVTWFAPAIVGHTPLLNWFVRRGTGKFQGTVAVGSASLGWLSPIVLQDIDVCDAAGRHVLTAPQISGNRSLLSLALDASDLGSFRVERPVVRVTCVGQQTNLEQLFASRSEQGPSSGSPSKLPGIDVEIVNAQLEVCDEDRQKEWKLSGVNVHVTVPRDAGTPLSVKIQGGAADSGRIDAELTAQLLPGKALTESVGQAHARVDDLGLEMLAPFLRRIDPGIQLDGRLGLRLDGRWETDSSGTPLLRVEGQIAARQLAVTAPGLLADRPRLDRLEVLYKLALRGQLLQVERLEVDCDVGKAWLTGTADAADDLMALVSRPGQEMGADIDLARLTAQLPRTLHLHSDVRLTAGKLTARLQALARDDGIGWIGSVRTTELCGVHAGQPVAWPEPVALAVQARRTGKALPVIDQFKLDSSFIHVQAAGSATELTLTADCDLGDLSKQLAQFVDLGKVRLAGRGSARATVRAGSNDTFTARADAKLTRVVLSGLTRQPWQEEDIDLHLAAAGTAKANGLQRIDSAEARARFGADEASATLLEPCAGGWQAPTLQACVGLKGDLARWQQRAQPFVEALNGWKLAGSADLDARVRYTVPSVAFEQVHLALGNARIQGVGLDLREPALDINAAGRWEPATGMLEVRNARLSCPTLTAETPRLQITPAPVGLPTVEGSVTLQGDLARLRQLLGAPEEQVAGRYSARAQFLPAGKALAADIDLSLEQITYGPDAAPVWREPTLRLSGCAHYDSAGDLLRLERLTVQASAWKCAAAGGVTQLSGSRQVTLAGNLDYDLEKLEPQLRGYLGQGVRLTGKDSRGFRIEGPLAGAQPVAVAVQPANSFPLRSWSGTASLTWQSLQAYGSQVGPAELRGRLADGWLRVEPLSTTLNQGRLHLEPAVRLEPGPMEVHIAKGGGIDRLQLTPALCASYIGYALPALAGAAQAQGEVSAALDACRVPVTGLAKADGAGRLTIHQARVSANPLVRELAVLLLKGPLEVSIVRESVVPVRLVNGRVYHQNLQLAFPEVTIKTSGSVGLDGTLDLVAELPVPPRWLGGKVGTALANQTIRLPIRGTMNHPKLDDRVLREANAKLVRDAAGDALRQEAEKNLNRLLKPKN